MTFYAGITLVAIGALGFLIRSREFVRVTLPQNFGSNPGFGCYETMVLPWFISLCLGGGLLASSWKLGLISFTLGLVLLGLVPQVLARLFGTRSMGDAAE